MSGGGADSIQFLRGEGGGADSIQFLRGEGGGADSIQFLRGDESDITWCKPNQEQIKEAIAYLAKGTAKYDEYFKSQAEGWKNIKLNIGVIGNSGVGKSSFINTIRGLNADSEGAAEVGETEQTFEVTEYPHPDHPNLVFSDLPGAGTENFRNERYLEMKEIGFDKYDFFIIICCSRFTEFDMYLAKEIKKKGNRTKIQDSVNNDLKAHPDSHDKQALLAKIRDNIAEKLKKENLYEEEKVFLIDSYVRSEYDFDALEECLIKKCPKLKQEALILSMSCRSVSMINQKVVTLRRHIWKVAAASAAVAAIPIPVPGVSIAVDTVLIAGTAVVYFHQLGLDKKSITMLAKANNKDPKNLIAMVYTAKPLVDVLTSEGVAKLIVTLGGPAVISEAAELASKIIMPIVGSLISGTISYVTTGRILNYILNMYQKAAIEVVNACRKKTMDLINDEED